MTEERLKEIYDYNNTEYCVGEYDINNEIIDELYNEVIRLREIIDKINNEVIKYKYTDTWGDTVVLAGYLEDILKENKNGNK